MKRERLTRLLIPVVLILLAGRVYAQDGGVYWHTDPGVKSCSMVIDPSLTQGQWQTFVRQAGALIAFKSLSPAGSLGKGRFALGVTYSITPVDQHDPAWINTFTHPDASCPLGDEIKMPTLRATWGVADALEMTGFWTSAPSANYGLAGGALKYVFSRESARMPATSATASFTSLTGVPDFNFNVFDVGLSTSKRVGPLTPYLGFRQSLAVGTETTRKVDLATENIPISHGVVGATWSVWKIGVAAEYDVSTVNTFALQVGYQP